MPEALCRPRTIRYVNKAAVAAAPFAALALAACHGGNDDNNNGTPPTAALSCAQLAGMSVPASAIGLPTTGATVAAAAIVPASGTGVTATPEYCLVSGSIAPVDQTAPKINFQVAMPTQWNSKAMMFGGGGYDGTVPAVTGNVPAGPTTQPAPLARGYAVFGSDSGHQAGALVVGLLEDQEVGGGQQAEHGHDEQDFADTEFHACVPSFRWRGFKTSSHESQLSVLRLQCVGPARGRVGGRGGRAGGRGVAGAGRVGLGLLGDLGVGVELHLDLELAHRALLLLSVRPDWTPTDNQPTLA